MLIRTLTGALIAGGMTCAPAQATDTAAAPTAGLPAAAYTLEKTHASLTFRVDHLGLSRYTARFTRLDATLTIDPADPAAATLTATVDPRSLETDFPLAQPDFDAQIQGPQFLDAAKYPEIAFRSTRIELTGPSTARLTGDLLLHGVTRPVAMNATFNGGYAGIPGGPPEARIGFSAIGTLKRSDFGITYGIPAPGTTLGVGDEVEFMLEVEFIGPPAARAAQ
ncbi:MAG: YceI family protein [Rhodospirillaceae bacterium]|nr:YceI family protein [Rhodospirillaceae bacterium]